MTSIHAPCLANTFTSTTTTPPSPTVHLRLIREEIATNYKLSLQEALAEVELQQGDIDRKLIYAHPRFVERCLITSSATLKKAAAR